VFPIWLKFKGGKGVATYVGILFSINLLLGIIFAASWGIIFLMFRYSSLSSIIGSISIPIYILITDQTSNAIFFGIMFVLIFFTHRENIKRLKNKEESKTKIY
jgi:glycerol-3-phosphate acyltransferase PlsY